MKKKIYQPPRTKITSVRTQQIICGSFSTEKLTEDNFDWGDSDPEGGYSTEQLTEDNFVW